MANKKVKKQNLVKNPSSNSGSPKSEAKPLSLNSYSIAFGAVLLLIIYIRFRLLGVPFERDEGEYAYIGNLILEGGIPYLDAYNMKLPGTYCMYSLFILLFGSLPTGIHTGLMLMSVATIILLYISFKRLFNPMIALVSATVYGLLSISMPFYGFAAHATHFINFFVMLGLFFYTRFYEKRDWVNAALIGLMFGLAFLMKQQAAVLMVMGGVLIILIELFTKPVNWKSLIKNSLIYSAAAVIPYLIVLLIMISAGAFDKFWFWTVEYARYYATLTIKWKDIKYFFNHSFDKMWADYPFIWLLGFAGIVLVWFNKQTLFQKIFVTVIALFCFASVCPGLYFREHYFILALPALGLLTAISLDYITGLILERSNNSFLKILPIAVVMIIGIYTIRREKEYYFSTDLELLSKRAYGYNPFVEAPEIAKYLRENSGKDDKIAILGSEPEILVYAKRKSASGYIYVYPLVEAQKFNLKMQKEMAAEIEKNKPLFFVYYNLDLSWLSQKGTPKYIFDWANKYIPANYDKVGMVDIPSFSGRSQFFWGPESGRTPQNPNFVYVFKKKGT